MITLKMYCGILSKIPKEVIGKKVSKLKHNFKKLIGLILCFALVFTVVMPLNALAVGEDEFSLNCEATNPTEGKIVFHIPDGTTTATVVGGTISDGKLLVLHDSLGDLRLQFDEAFNKDQLNVKVSADDGYSVNLPVNGDNEAYIDESIHFPGGTTLTISVEPKGPAGGPGDEGGHEGFDGRAYFVWASDNKLCYHLFEELIGRVEDDYPLNVIKASEVTDQSGNNIDYVFGQDMADWVLARDFEDEAGNVKYTNADIQAVLGDGHDDHGITLNPAGAENTENSINTNGDMNFRASIIKDGYEAITFETNEDELEYVPGFLDGAFHSSTVDISGTTKSSPAVFNLYLLEKTIKLGLAEASKSPIKSVKALDINPAAVSIADKGDSNFEITFNSNFYDRVVFELTDEAGATYYIRLARTLMEVHDNFGPETKDPKVVSYVYFPADMSKDDFEIVATIVFDDGTQRTEMAKPEVIGFVNGQDYDGYEGDAGKNTKIAALGVGVTDHVTNVYFTAVYKGALDGNVYGGTLGGSGKGFNYDLEERDVIFE